MRFLSARVWWLRWMSLRRAAVSVVALACLFVAVAPSAADTEHGWITGTIRDASGLPIPGVTVIARDERTAEERSVVSTAQGRYLVTMLKPSLYTVQAALPAFATAEARGRQLLAGRELSLDLTMMPADQTETVTVVGEAALVDTSSARQGANVNEREVSELPINGRQLSQLYLQAPGALNSGTGTFSDIRFSGRAVEQNVIRYDGVEGSAVIDAAPGNLNGEIPSPFRLQSSLENVQEFRVDSNSYPAEFGTGTGGQVTVVTKSGTNTLRGSAFEYFRDDALDKPNAFDPVVNGETRKSSLRLHQFGASLSGPLVRDRVFFFGSYEGYRLDSGINFVEAVPSAAARARAVPSIVPLLDAFTSPRAVILPGASANPDFDIAQLQELAQVNEDAFSLRLDAKLTDRHKFYLRYFRDKGVNDQPEGVTGRRAITEARPQNAVAALQSTLSGQFLNELKVGYNRSDTEVNGVAPVVNGIDLSQIVINVTGSVANNGIAGQGSSSGVALPGGLLRQNSATNGRGAPYQPYSLSFMDSLSYFRGNHFFKFGAELRLIRMKTDRLGGTTYTFSNLNDFLANRLQSAQYLGDLSSPSPFHDGATGMRQAQQEYYIGYVQDEWRVNRRLTFNAGLRYDYYTPLREARSLAVNFDTVNGRLLPSDQDSFRTSKNNFQPRLSFTFSPTEKGSTLFRGGFGILVGPGQTEDQIQPIESDRIASTISGGSFPVDPATLSASFLNNPLNRSYQPRAYTPDYRVPEKVYQYSVGVQQQLPYRMALSAAYVGSQGRNLFLRSITNRIVSVRTNPNPTGNAVVVREFDIVQADGTILRPFAEIDVKTSGGHDSYNALQLSLTRPSTSGLTLNAQYTLSRSFGNSAGSNEAQTAANNAVTLDQFDYDLGFNRFDVRHTLNLSAIWSLPVGHDRKVDLGGFGNALLGNWDIGMIVNARSGLPIDLLVTRPDVVYVDGAGNVFGTPAAGRNAVINTPGGGASRNVRRPNLVPGVNPYIKDGKQWLNPAAFSIPAPGEFGSLQRGAIRGPGFKQLDLVLNKRIRAGNRSWLDLRLEVFNLLNTVNYANPSGRLNNALGTGANQIQPNQPFTQAAAGSSFGVLTSTVGSTVGLGTNRQMQLALRLNF
jgi:carboxypeptidase family protein/TonB-dependent receptor-like protein